MEEKSYVVNWVDANASTMAKMSDTIFNWAEPGLRECRSVRLLIDYLREQGFEARALNGALRDQRSAFSPSTMPRLDSLRRRFHGRKPLFPTGLVFPTLTICSVSRLASRLLLLRKRR